ncbi:hypothetical protein [Streptomyces sp. NPDC018693]
MLLHCAHARYVWNLAVEQHAHWKPGRASAPVSPSSVASRPRRDGRTNGRPPGTRTCSSRR